MKSFLFFIVLAFGSVTTIAQSYDADKVVQFSGVVVVEDDNREVVPLPYATVGVIGTSRGTVTELDGFFSLVVLEGEEIEFRTLGFKSQRITIPDSVNTYYSVVIELERESTELPLIEILPIPSREHFKIEFLAMDVDDVLQDRARANLEGELMANMIRDLPVDGGEASRYELKQQAASYYSYGQFKPQKILDAFAWKKFIQAWKNGDFKKKKKKK